MDYHRSDHIYSADRDNEETDTDNEVGDSGHGSIKWPLSERSSWNKELSGLSSIV